MYGSNPLPLHTKTVLAENMTILKH